MMSKLSSALLIFGLFASLSSQAKPVATPPQSGNNAAIMARKQVPILCYHQIRDWKPTDSKV